MSRQKVRIDQLVVPAGTPDGQVLQVAGGELVYGAPDAGVHAASSWNTAADGDDTLTLAATPLPESLRIEVNRELARPDVDYTLAGTVVTFASPLTAGDEVADTYLTGEASPTPAILTAGALASLASLPVTAYAAHRGGDLIAPDSTMAGFQRAFDDGADALEFDIQLTSDGVPVVMHDTTVDRTTDGTGTVASKTAAQVAALNVDSANWFGSTVYGNLQVPTLAEVLDTFGGRVCMFIEAKDTAANSAIISAIQSRGLEQSICVQVANPTQAADFVTAGIPVGVVVVTNSEATGASSPANCLAAGVEWVFVNGDTTAPVTDANVSAYTATSLKVVMWSVARHYRRDHYLGLGVDGFVADDPIYLRGNTADYSLASDPFADQTFWHGALTLPILAGTEATATNRGSWSAPDKWGVGTAGTTRLEALQGWAQVENPAGSYTLTIDITYAALGSDATRWAGVKFAAPTDFPYDESTTPAVGDDGYVTLLRQNGTLGLYKRVGGSAPTLLSSISTAALTAGTTATLQIDVTPTSVTVTRTDVGGTNSVTSSDTTFRGAYAFFTRNADTTAQGAGVWFSNGTKVEV